MLAQEVYRAPVAANADTIGRANPRGLSTADGVGRRSDSMLRPTQPSCHLRDEEV